MKIPQPSQCSKRALAATIVRRLSTAITLLLALFLAVCVSLPAQAETVIVSTLAGSGEPGFADGKGSAARFNQPHVIVIDAMGKLLVADTGNRRIRIITPEGEVSTLAGSEGCCADGEENSARSNKRRIEKNAAGDLYVVDTANHRILKFTPKGEISTLAGKEKGFADGEGSEARFNHPHGIVIDAAGNLYVGDTENHRIRKIVIQRP
ncbi:MAG: hypothetical protein LBQ75_07275 [Zoogloeaceae bacterium]|jgi:sugar lactone lactonase YvrE|nr:hypothetical protein [Zoogloeaceae bacterium]